MTRSTSNGCGCVRSASRTPWVPSTRSPRNSILSMAPETSDLGCDADQLAPTGAHLPVQHLLDDRDRVRPGVHQPAVEQEAADDAHHAVAELFLVQEDALARADPFLELVVEVEQHDARVRASTEREMRPRDAELVVGVEVVRRRQQRHDAREALVPQPQDLLVAPHLPVVAGITTGALAHRQLVLDDPREVARLDAAFPLPPHTVTPTRRAASTAGRTSCTRT